MTFSSNPSIQKIKGATLRDKIYNLNQSEWGMSTNLQAALNKILEVAVTSGCAQSDLPEKLFIISDMEFNSACGRSTNYQAARNKFEQAGYIMPEIVFWNVQARNNQSPETGISLTNESYDYKHGETVNIPKQSLASKFADATTNKGKAPQSIIYMERPADSTLFVVCKNNLK